MRIKYLLASVVTIFSVVLAFIFYFNSTGFENDENKIGFVKDYLVDTKSEEWLQSRIDEGKQNYRNKLQQENDERLEVLLNHKAVLEKCRAKNETFRMKNSYECDKAWRGLGGKGAFNLTTPIKVTNQSVLFNKQEELLMIDEAILRDCESAKTIKQARKIGCFYPK